MPYFRISDKYNRKILYMFLILVAIKFLLSLQYTTPWIFADETVYVEVAKNILEADLFSKLEYCTTYPPGYSLFLSIAYFFSTDKTIIYHIMLLINCILTSSAIFPSYFILKKYCSENISFLGSIVVSTLPSVTLYTFALLSENLFIPLFIFSAWFLIESYEKNEKIWDILAGFSIFFLFFTRAIGIAMVLGFFASFLYYISINLKNKNIYIILKEKCFLLLSFFVPMLSWIIYKKFVISLNVIGYDTGEYLNTLLKAFSSIDSFLTILNLLLHEIEFLILASYFIMFFIVSFFIFKILKSIKLKIDTSLVLLTIYFLVSSSILILITITHMYETFTGGDPYYSIFGRYIDPIIPLIFLLGFIGIDQMYKNSNKINIKITSALISLYIFTILIFLFTFPYDYYKFSNMLSIFYIQGIKTIVPIETFIAIFSLISLVIFCLSINHKKLRTYLFLFFILFSIFISIYPFQIELRNSSNTENVNQIGRYLQKHSGDDTLVLMDREDFNRYWGPQMWFLTRFWMKGDLIRHSTKEDPSGVYTEYAKNVDYIISSKLLPYQPINCSKVGYKLYNLTVSEEQPIEVPYTIDIGLNDECIIENFHGAENQKIRWTRNSSKVLIKCPADMGTIKLIIKTSGHRPPDNPAHIVLYINSKKIGEAFNPGETSIYSFVVPQYCLNDYYQILEIKTNTWRPSDYGLPDKRDLGIQIDWIEIDKVEPKMSYVLSGFYSIEHWYNIPTCWTSNNATLFIYATTENRDSNLSFNVVSFYKPRNLQIYLNDELIHKQNIPTSFVEVEIPLKLKEGENILRFYTPDSCQRPVDVPELKNKDNRCLSLAFQNIMLTTIKKNYDVNFIEYSIPDLMVTNSFYSTNITIKNEGTGKWDKNSENPVHVSYHWLKDGKVVLWDGIRNKLPCDVTPDTTIEMDMNVKTPHEEGNYTLIIDLVKEGITWFETQGAVPLKKNVTVTRDGLKQISMLEYQTEYKEVNELKKLIESTLDSSATSFEGKCGRVYGFYAGSGYPQIWVRDSATIIPVTRYFYSDEFLRTWIEEFLINQAENGSIYDYRSPMGCDKNTVETDQETSLVHSAYQYYKISGNKSWLLKEINGKTLIDRLDSSLRYVLNYRYNSTYGLVTGAFTADWGDVQFEDSPGTDITNRTHWTCDIYDNAMFYRACEELSVMHSELGDKENTAFRRGIAQSIKENTNKYLWQPDMGFYKMHVHLTSVKLDFTESDMFPMGGNAIAVRADLANHTQASQIFTVAAERKKEANATTIGCVLYPPYPEGFFANPIMDEEHEYQNGGQWDWFAGRLILAEFENGFSEDAILHLKEISNQDVNAEGLYEWYTLNGTGKGSSDYAGSAGVLGQCIIEGYFGVYLSHDTLEIKPRLGNSSGSICLYEPATDVWVSYNYSSFQNNTINLTYESNFQNSGKISVLVPHEKKVSEILVDNAPVPYSIDKIGNDTYVSFITDFNWHECEIILT